VLFVGARSAIRVEAVRRPDLYRPESGAAVSDL
jgi:hypothetical protein